MKKIIICDESAICYRVAKTQSQNLMIITYNRYKNEHSLGMQLRIQHWTLIINEQEYVH